MYHFADQKEGKETVFTIKTQDLKFGVGALRELWSAAISLEMKRIARWIPSLLGRLEEEIHDGGVKAHNVANKGRGIALCTALHPHNLAFYAHLGAREA